MFRSSLFALVAGVALNTPANASYYETTEGLYAACLTAQKHAWADSLPEEGVDGFEVGLCTGTFIAIMKIMGGFCETKREGLPMNYLSDAFAREVQSSRDLISQFLVSYALHKESGADFSKEPSIASAVAMLRSEGKCEPK